MFIKIVRRTPTLSAPKLIEVISPRSYGPALAGVENFLAALVGSRPFCLEMAAAAHTRQLLIRADSEADRHHISNQLAAAYPQAELRPLETASHPELDPAEVRDGEHMASCELALRGPAYLPIRLFSENERGVTDHPGWDPVPGLLAALGGLPPGWRGLSRLALRPLPPDWSRPYLALASPRPEVKDGRYTTAASTSMEVTGMAVLLVLAAIGLRGYLWYVEGDWLPLGLLGGALVAGLFLGVWLLTRRASAARPDPRLVQEKISRPAFAAQLHLAILAPNDVPPDQLRLRLNHLAAAYAQFNLPTGNGLRVRAVRFGDRGRRAFALPRWGRTAMTLNAREVAGLWHLPATQDDPPMLERTTARRILPLSEAVATGCSIGVSSHQGHQVSVALPEDVLHRNLLLVAKTGRGKSSLMLRLAEHVMRSVDRGGNECGLFLLDPHEDLALAALGLVPPERRDNVVYLDLTNTQCPFGLNLLDTGLGWDRDQAVANALTIFKREFDQYWGPRMEDAFRFALTTLFEANQTLCHNALDGRSEQHTILDIPALLSGPGYRRTVLQFVNNPATKAWWSGYYDTLDRRLQMEIANPVQTKIHRFAGTVAGSAIVGQQVSTIDPTAWVPSSAIVIVNTGKSTIGEDTASLVGSTLVNLVGLQVAKQSRLSPEQRRQTTLMVDEFHTMPGADYELILGELRKYGANLLLATQSLARLDVQDRRQHRALRAAVFANIDGLFAFHTSAEDAHYLVPEFGREIEVEDVVALGEHQCYVKLSSKGERLPTFSVRLDPPRPSDPAVAASLARASVASYGRDIALVTQDIERGIDRIYLARKGLVAEGQPGRENGGVPTDVVGNNPPEPLAPPPLKRKRVRSRNRPPGTGQPTPQQSLPWDVREPDSETESGDQTDADHSDV